ncbi:exo-beta-D-glucosaminidase [Pseudozyma hubeiensis SY62]|uniref:Exo-beta-D-glucosaminidase n=1 Tax=Pseudozyma hubeiensis (strain SY62) TaxID=1305764 RepID=R9P4H4_PSEHS|nr:exo-beta-D-glucosaminidase [Pseudozyma hubeiensis SY62]GAC96157.1 exo-beta-D-glucosaminidase [Pseudozyma hubeiensis SY62]
MSRHTSSAAGRAADQFRSNNDSVSASIRLISPFRLGIVQATSCSGRWLSHFFKVFVTLSSEEKSGSDMKSIAIQHPRCQLPFRWQPENRYTRQCSSFAAKSKLLPPRYHRAAGRKRQRQPGTRRPDRELTLELTHLARHFISTARRHRLIRDPAPLLRLAPGYCSRKSPHPSTSDVIDSHLDLQL